MASILIGQNHIEVDRGDGGVESPAVPRGTDTLVEISEGIADLLSELQDKADLSQTQPVSVDNDFASEASLMLVCELLIDLLAELEKKVNVDEVQPVSGAVTANPSFSFASSDLTLSTTPAYSSGDVLADKLAINPNGKKILYSLTVIDTSNQGAPFDVIIFDADYTQVASKNDPWNVSAADMKKVRMVIPVTAGDFVNVGLHKVATIQVGAGFNAAGLIYVGTISKGSGTYSANGLTLHFVFA